MGYDMAEMTTALQDGLARLRAVDPQRLAQVSRAGTGPFEFLQLLGMGKGVMDWFRFRCELLAAKLRRAREAVRAAAGPDFVFGSDTHPASLSAFVGHDHTAWG